MNKSALLRRVLLAPPALRNTLITPLPLSQSRSRQYATSHMPSVLSRSFWENMIPKPLRNRSSRQKIAKNIKSKEWNPATFFIWIFLLIGSMSIQMIALRKESDAFSRRTEAKIGLLKEIVERIQNGEEIDVEGLLGTGDEKREQEWEEVLQEIERDDRAWEESRKNKPKVDTKAEAPILEQKPQISAPEIASLIKSEPTAKPPSGFY